MILHRARVRGVSLVEALIAMAVMAFGMLALVGVQSTLRLNGDAAKQRSEAVRIAQAAIEDRRGFSVLQSVAPGVSGYNDIVAFGPEDVAGSNTTFVRTDTVTASSYPAARMTTLTTDIAWADRAGQAQGVRLSTVVAGVSPELAGSLGLPMNRALVRQPGGRHRAVPVEAVDADDGRTSIFAPPGGGSLRWVFNNQTGLITSTCANPESCTPLEALLLTGYVRFATGALQPTTVDAENPPGFALSTGVQVLQTAPAETTIACFVQNLTGARQYFCAVPTSATLPGRWSGRSELTGLSLADNLADAQASRQKVCRYTPVQNDTPARGNIDHPYNYVDVSVPLTNQNFLVIAAGNGSTAFTCPGDDTTTPYINGNTRPHQPRT